MNVTVPGPLICVHKTWVAPGGAGNPSSDTDPFNVNAESVITVASGPAPTTGGRFTGGPPVWYSMWRMGGAVPLKDSAVRVPVPVMMMTRALPVAHPGRLMISWMMKDRSGVC